MRLIQAARRFDRTECLDAYTGAPAFMAQLGLYDDTKRDSEAGERRVLSTGPDAVVPSRRVVSAAGAVWIIGHANPDTYRGQVIRVGLVAHEASHLAQVRTLGQACRGEPGLDAYAAQAWIKNAADNQESSDLTAVHNLHFASTEPVTKGMLVTMGSQHHITRDARVGPAGTLIVLSDLLDEPAIDTATTASSGAWDPISQTLSGGPATATVLRARWQSLYEYRNSMAPKFGPGDLQLVVAKASMTPTPGMTMTLSDGAWQIQSAADEGDVWICRATRHG